MSPCRDLEINLCSPSQVHIHLSAYAELFLPTSVCLFFFTPGIWAQKLPSLFKNKSETQMPNRTIWSDASPGAGAEQAH